LGSVLQALEARGFEPSDDLPKKESEPLPSGEGLQCFTSSSSFNLE